VGFFSADTWSMFTVWIRNTILIQLTVILAISVALLAPRPLLEGFQHWPRAGQGRWTTVGLFLIAVVGIAGNQLRMTRRNASWTLKGKHWLRGLSVAGACLAAALGIARWSHFEPFTDGPIDFVPAVAIAGLSVALAFCLQPLAVKLAGIFRTDPDRPSEVNYTQGWVQLAIVVPLMVTGYLVAAVLWGQSRSGDLSGLHAYGDLFRTCARYWPFPLAVVFVSLWLLSICSMRQPSQAATAGRWERVKPRLTAFLAPIPAVLVLHAMLCAIMLLLHKWAQDPGPGAQAAFVAAPVLVLYAFSLVIVILNGMMGRESTEDVREWWSRLGAWLVIYGFAWMVIAMAAVYGPALASKIVHWRPWALAGGWVGTTIAGLFAGHSGSTGGEGNKSKSNKILELIAAVAPFVFIAGLLVAVSAGLDYVIRVNSGQDWSSIGGEHSDPSCFLVVSLGVWALCVLSLVLLAARVDINEFSLSRFYRNRLVRCYLGATRDSAKRQPQNFTGFDDLDDLKLADLDTLDGVVGPPKAPFPIVNCALNLGGSSDLAVHTRHSAAFTMTPLRCGSSYESRGASGPPRALGYLPTADYGSREGAPTLGQAIAISGAAASPNMGYHTSPVVAFLLTVFNVRLGWWLPNPMRSAIKFPSPHFSLRYLLAELFGGADDTSRFLNVSDGGHFENLAAYELIRRKCRVIVISDAECDPELSFEGLGRLIRMCEVDFRAKITIDVRAIHPEDSAPWSRRNFAVGTIDYAGGAPQGVLVYLKASMTDDEDTAVRQYKASHPEFPHESTGNQFYKEDQFESYRRLGREIAARTFETDSRSAELRTLANQLLEKYGPGSTETN
jgi:hypothetical protein